MEIIKRIKIYSVIEMSPWRFGANIEMSNDESFEDFAIRIYKEHGIKNIEKLDNYSTRSIPISEIINDKDLSIIIEKDWELESEENIEEELEDIGSFEGGIVIIFNDADSITHNCCGAISDYKNWVNFIQKKPINWEEIWIGHPWLYGRIRKGVIHLSDYHDETMEKPKDDNTDIEYLIDLPNFEKELYQVVDEIKAFKYRIEMILKEKGNKYFKELSEAMVDKKIISIK